MKLLKRLIVVLLIFVLIVFLGIFALVYMMTNDRHKPYMELIEKYSQENELEKELVTAIIKVESDFKVDAKSHADAEGLMQLIPDASKWISQRLGEEYDFEKVYEPETNIRYGTHLLKYLINYYKSIDYAIMAYNAGSGNVDNWIANGILTGKKSDYENIPFAETRNYISKVKDQYHLNKKIYNVYYKDSDSSRIQRSWNTLLELSKNIFKK